MPHFFVILFKINIVLLLFSASYYLVLRRLTFYGLNRIFLVFGILFASAYPFIDLSSLFDAAVVPEIVPQISRNLSQIARQDNVPVYWQAASVLLYSGTILMAAKLIIQFTSLARMHRNSTPGLIGGHRVRILRDEVGPFSFLRNIYINPGLHRPNDINTILKHEQVHADEWHTLDIVLAEINIIFYWFNPGVWLMKKAIRENLEFITDARILKSGTDKKTYQYSLLQAGVLTPPVAIVNNFHLCDLKKRIRMMNVRRSSNIQLSRYLMVLPILLMLTLAFAVNTEQVKGTLITVNTRVLNKKPAAASLSPENAQVKKPVKKKPSLLTKQPAGDTIHSLDTGKGDLQRNDLLPDSLQGPLSGALISGKRIKIITVKRNESVSAHDKTAFSFSFSDTLNGKVRKIMLRLKDPEELQRSDISPEELQLPGIEAEQSQPDRRRVVLNLNRQAAAEEHQDKTVKAAYATMFTIDNGRARLVTQEE